MANNHIERVRKWKIIFICAFLKKKKSSYRHPRDKIITVQFLDRNPEKEKKNRKKKKINEKISRKVQTKVDNCTEDRLNFYTEDRTIVKRKRNADLSAQNSKRIDPYPWVRDIVPVCSLGDIVQQKVFRCRGLIKLDFERIVRPSCRHIDAIIRNFLIFHPIIR